MSLFRASDVAKAASGAEPLAARLPSGDPTFIQGSKTELFAFVELLMQGDTVHFVTHGRWSAHELLAEVLRRTGPARVALTSWALTEDPVRQLVEMLHSGAITELSLLVDERIEVHSPEAYQLARANIRNIKLTHIHAKVVVIINDAWAVTILSSANITRNKRIEAGAIFENREVADWHYKWITDTIGHVDRG